MIADFGHPDLLVRAVDEEIIRYLAAHPEAQNDGPAAPVAGPSSVLGA
jgi:hypothetical protein